MHAHGLVATHDRPRLPLRMCTQRTRAAAAAAAAAAAISSPTPHPSIRVLINVRIGWWASSHPMIGLSFLIEFWNCGMAAWRLGGWRPDCTLTGLPASCPTSFGCPVVIDDFATTCADFLAAPLNRGIQQVAMQRLLLPEDARGTGAHGTC